MERKLMSELIKWKDKAGRKPLLLEGARQVGKTWLLKEFGKRHFENVAYINYHV
jgi:predicted AAA+ superfamily ATPase